jgi:transposase
MKFKELSEAEWEFIKPYLPPPASTGRPRADDRKTINGILYVSITGCKWVDMPRAYGAPVTAWRRFKNWQEKGVWNEIVRLLRDKVYAAGKLSLETVSIDSKTVTAKKGANASDTTDIKRRKARRSTLRSVARVYR